MTGEMSVTADTPVVPGGSATTRRWVGFRFGLLLGVLALAVCGGLVGSRTAELSQLNAAITAGRVSQVRVNGALPPGATGSALVHISWRDGEVSYVTQVVQQSDAAVSTPQSSQDEHVVGDLVGQLRSLDRSGSLMISTDDTGPLSGPIVAGWQLPGWFGVVLMVVWLATVALLAHGPEPWWATRWAWFWAILLLAPVGVPLFLLMAGPPPGIPQPDRQGRRLTGGWAFLAAVVIESVVSNVT